MNCRAFLNTIRAWTVETVGEERYDDLAFPPTPRERKQRRLAELRALGVPLEVSGDA